MFNYFYENYSENQTEGACWLSWYCERPYDLFWAMTILLKRR